MKGNKKGRGADMTSNPIEPNAPALFVCIISILYITISKLAMAQM